MHLRLAQPFITFLKCSPIFYRPEALTLSSAQKIRLFYTYIKTFVIRRLKVLIGVHHITPVSP